MTTSSLRRQLPSLALLIFLFFSALHSFAQQTYGGHTYEFIYAPGVSWSEARAAAEARCKDGKQGYLVTVTSAGEMNFVASISQYFNPSKNECDYTGGWMGGSDANPEGEWRWVTGPEAGQAFVYTNWQNGQPDGGMNENYVHYYYQNPDASLSGKWNDAADAPNPINVNGYVVEYGGVPCPPSFCSDPATPVTVCRNGNTMNITCGQVLPTDVVGGVCATICNPCPGDIPNNSDCDKTNNCYRFRYSYVVNSNNTVTLKFVVTVNCNRDLSDIAFELPRGAKAKSPNGPGKIENPTNNPFYSVKFEPGSGFKNGNSATFQYTLTAAEFDNLTTIRVRAKSSNIIGSVTFNAKACKSCPTNTPSAMSNESDEMVAAPSEVAPIVTSAIFPNPTTGQFNVSLRGYLNQTVQVRITNASGKEVERRKVSVNSTYQVSSFNLQGLAKGLYYVTIVGNNSSTTSKLMIK